MGLFYTHCRLEGPFSVQKMLVLFATKCSSHSGNYWLQLQSLCTVTNAKMIIALIRHIKIWNEASVHRICISVEFTGGMHIKNSVGQKSPRCFMICIKYPSLITELSKHTLVCMYPFMHCLCGFMTIAVQRYT